MKKVSIIIPHFKTARWSSICLWHLKKFPIPVDHEIILVDNSPGHPSIRAISETSLGDDVKIISGDPEFTSHGMAYDIGFTRTLSDFIFTCETDSFPFKNGWFDEYLKLSKDYDLIGPEIPQSSGRYIHPAGTLISREVVNSALQWQFAHEDWIFCPGAAVTLGTSDKPYHVVAHEEWLGEHEFDDPAMDLWKRVGPWQEMRCFDDDTWEDYPRRTGIVNLEPVGQPYHNKIGFEAGQWLSYFADKRGFKIFKAPVELLWMAGHEGQQAASSIVMGGFTHCWGGTVCEVSSSDMNRDVVDFKKSQENDWWMRLPELLRSQIDALR